MPDMPETPAPAPESPERQAAQTLKTLIAERDPLGIVFGVTDEEERYAAYDEVRAIDPDMARSVAGWIVMGRDACFELPRDPRVGKHMPEGMPQATATRAGAAGRVFQSMLNMDPPEHSRVRRLTAKAFTPRAIQRVRGHVERIANELLDGVAEAGHMDVVADFAQQLPIAVIGEILGVPTHDHSRLLGWADIMARAMDVSARADLLLELERVSGEIEEYFLAIFDQRRDQPKDDFLQAMIDARDEGDRLTQEELVSNCVLILIAGFETTVNLIGNGLRALLDAPDQLACLLEDLDRVPQAIEEFLRFDTPGQMVPYRAQAHFEWRSHTINPGDALYLFLGAANRDPRAFGDPHRLDVLRTNAADHVTFASGAHYCLGAALARLEGDVAFRTLLTRCQDLRLADTPERRATQIVRGHARLPVSFRPELKTRP